MRACVVIPSLDKHRQTMVDSYSYHRSSSCLLFFSSSSLRKKSKLSQWLIVWETIIHRQDDCSVFLSAPQSNNCVFHTRLPSQFLINCWPAVVFWCSMQTRNMRIHCSFTALSLERYEHDTNASVSSRTSDASDLYSIFFSSEFYM